MPETQTAEEAESLAKATLEGLYSFVDSEVLPLEEQYRELLSNEHKLFKEDGRLVDEVAEARLQVRRKSAEAGFYAMLAPEEIGGGGLTSSVAVRILEALYRKYGPGRLLIGWANGFLSSPLIASFVDGPSHMFASAGEAIRKDVLPGLLAGETTVCFGLTEPDAGSDVWGLKAKAVRDGDEWVINGT